MVSPSTRHGADDPRVLLVVAVGLDRGVVGAVRHCKDGAAHCAVGAFVQRRGQGLQVSKPGVAEELVDAAGTDLIGDDLRLEVAQHLARHADIGEQQIDQVLVPGAGAQ